MVCKYHEQCSKELAVNVAGSSESALRVLKSWVVLGAGMPSKKEHMCATHKTALLNALQTNSLLSARELDELAVAGTIVSPFAALAAPRVKPVLPKRGGILGEANAGISSELHAKMESMAREGLLPVTTASQRLRNEAGPSSTYTVPADLREALVA
eukprot:4688213-Amphidinium_carterae.1